MEGWRRTDCGVGVTSPQGLLPPDWLVEEEEEERPMAVSYCAVERQAGFHHVRGPVRSLTQSRCPQPHWCH